MISMACFSQCASCEFWGGEREFEPEIGNYRVTVESATAMGSCQIKGASKASDSCPQFRLHPIVEKLRIQRRSQIAQRRGGGDATGRNQLEHNSFLEALCDSETTPTWLNYLYLRFWKK